MSIEYAVRFEGKALVCHLIVDDTDFLEVHRIPCACQGEDPILCSLLIEVCQLAAERDAGQLLPWIFSDDDADMRVCWTSPLDRSDPDMIGSSR